MEREGFGARNPAVIDKVAAVFDSYWHSPDFKPYDHDEFLARTEARSRCRTHDSFESDSIYALNRFRSGFSNRSNCRASRGTIGISGSRLLVPERL